MPLLRTNRYIDAKGSKIINEKFSIKSTTSGYS